MAESGDERGGGRRSRITTVRVLNVATTDRHYPQFKRRSDSQMLVAFLDRFDRLGWLPPTDEEERRLLEAHDVIMHPVNESLAFYEFCSKGARGERSPWLTLFFHVDGHATVRILGVWETSFVGRQREAILEVMRARAIRLDDWLRRRKPKGQ